MITKTAGPQDLNTLGNVTSSNIKGNYAASTAANTNINLSVGWFPATPTTWSRLYFAMTHSFLGDPVVKVGDTVNYVAGWRWFSSSAATNAINQGQSSIQTWYVVDNAVALTL